ncbi:hypothetical protein K3495_g6463 [Podosphaera aphanis]|nr:hypothetical protein K3495_g6463 [Podosphaera aphanis]
MDNEQLPSSIEEVEALIKQLYGTGNTANVSITQEILHKLQISPQGWQLANALLSRKDEQVRFFAALTFIVKLNTDAKSLSKTDAHLLLLTLIDSIVQWLEDGEGPLVGRKLCSALVAYFLKFSSSWSRCVKHLLYCLCLDKALPYSSVDGSSDTNLLVQNISDRKSQVIFWFSSTLVEDVSKMDSNSMKAHNFHRYVKPNADDIVPLIGKFIFNGPNQALIHIQKEALTCFQSWVSYSHRSFIDKETDLEALYHLTQPALLCIIHDELYETVVELFTDVLSSYSKFLRPQDFESLHKLFDTPWAQEKYKALIQGDYDWNSLQFGYLLLAFGDATVNELTQNIHDPLCARYLVLLSGLLNAQGYAVAEDKIYVPALEFWSTFVESMVDESFGQKPGSSPSWFPTAQRYVMQVVELCWRKSQFPNAQEFNAWDSVDRVSFKDARRDFSDLIQQFYLVAGRSLSQIWIEKILRSTAEKNWLELEASLYCLAQLNDSIADVHERDEMLDQVFTKILIGLFSDPQLEIFTKTRRAYLNLIIGYAKYFEKRPSILPDVLNFSFAALKYTSLASQASRSILKLCSDCRNNLLPDLPGFLRHYNSIASDYTLDCDVKESVIEGIACIIQVLPNEASKIGPLNELLTYVEADASCCLSFISSQPATPDVSVSPSTVIENETKSIESGVLALKCLLGIARGIQASDDQPIDLETEKDGTNSIWVEGEGFRIQQRVYNIISLIFDVLGHRGEVIEECCLVWRHGLRESEPGPFVLPAHLIAQLITKTTLRTPRLGLVIKTAASLVTSKLVQGHHDILGPMLAWISHLLYNLGNPAEDSEISHAAIIFIHRLVVSHTSIFLSYQPPASLEFLFMFALEAIKGSEPLPKGSAAEFWSAFLSLNSLPDNIQKSYNSALQVLGPLIAQALIFNVGGSAARSELEKLSDPIKKLTTSQLYAKRWIEAALFDPNFPSDKVNNNDKTIFLQKITNLRGAKATTQVVKDFWLACRGSNFAYAS